MTVSLRVQRIANHDAVEGPFLVARFHEPAETIRILLIFALVACIVGLRVTAA